MVSTELCKLLVQSLLAIGIDIPNWWFVILVRRQYMYVISLSQSTWRTVVTGQATCKALYQGWKREGNLETCTKWRVICPIGYILLSPVKISVSLTLLFEVCTHLLLYVKCIVYVHILCSAIFSRRKRPAKRVTEEGMYLSISFV